MIERRQGYDNRQTVEPSEFPIVVGMDFGSGPRSVTVTRVYTAREGDMGVKYTVRRDGLREAHIISESSVDYYDGSERRSQERARVNLEFARAAIVHGCARLRATTWKTLARRMGLRRAGKTRLQAGVMRGHGFETSHFDEAQTIDLVRFEISREDHYANVASGRTKV